MRRRLTCSLISLISVSIHASVKDATRYQTKDSLNAAVSIHASVKDATGRRNNKPGNYPGFNPRICKRCDRPVVPCFEIDSCFNPRICKRCDVPTLGRLGKINVSIHASVKDATDLAKRNQEKALFQSTHL